MDYKSNLIMKLIKFETYPKAKIKKLKKVMLKLSSNSRWLFMIVFGIKFIL